MFGVRCAWCDTLKNVGKQCVSIQSASVRRFKTSVCGLVAGGDVLNRHAEVQIMKVWIDVMRLCYEMCHVL